MDQPNRSSQVPAIVPRSPPSDAALRDPAHFAWEVVRRRGDYAGEAHRARETVVSPMVRVIRAAHAASPWGLLFRGRP